MSVVSLTRLRLRSLRTYPAFMWHTLASVRQLKRADGFLDGMLASEGRRAFWTFTVWTDEAAMLAFRDSSAHRTAMPKLLEWCDEAAVARYEHAGDHVPDCTDALAHMRSGYRLSHVRFPSRDQAAGRLSSTLSTPRPGLPIRPQRQSKTRQR